MNHTAVIAVDLTTHTGVTRKFWSGEGWLLLGSEHNALRFESVAAAEKYMSTDPGMLYQVPRITYTDGQAISAVPAAAINNMPAPTHRQYINADTFAAAQARYRSWSPRMAA